MLFRFEAESSVWLPESWCFLLSETYGTAPIFADLSACILSRFAMSAIVIFEHLVGAPMQLHVALADNVPQAVEAVFFTQTLKLKVVVKHQGWPGEMPGPA